jgi:hypothetical protein
MVLAVALTAEERLITIRVKIKRAKKHLSELERVAGRYRDRYAHVVPAGAKPKSSQGKPNLIRLPIIHFDMLAMAGDVLHNLRSALDHVVYHLALVADPNASDDVLRKVAFPIGKSLEDYKTLRTRRLEGVIKPRAVKFIDSLKPYKGGNDALWRLNEASNIDKHRKLINVGVDILCEGDGFEGTFWLKADDPAFHSVFVPERKQLHTGIESPLELLIAERDALVPALHQLTNYVEALIEYHFKDFLE